MFLECLVFKFLFGKPTIPFKTRRFRLSQVRASPSPKGNPFVNTLPAPGFFTDSESRRPTIWPPKLNNKPQSRQSLLWTSSADNNYLKGWKLLLHLKDKSYSPSTKALLSHSFNISLPDFNHAALLCLLHLDD